MSHLYEKAGALIRSLDLKIEWESMNVSVDTVQIEEFPRGFYDWHAHAIYELHYIKTNMFPGYRIPRRHINQYRMEEIRKYTKTKCSRPIRCNELARFAFLSTRYFSRIKLTRVFAS